jgi:hypothetical protein
MVVLGDQAADSMVLALKVIGQMLLTFSHETALHEQVGITMVQDLTVMHMATHALTEVVAVVVIMVLLQLVVVELVSSVMASTSLVLPTHVKSANSSVSRMTQPSSKLVSISKNTMTFQSRLRVPTFLSQSSLSPTHLLTTI